MPTRNTSATSVSLYHGVSGESRVVTIVPIQDNGTLQLARCQSCNNFEVRPRSFAHKTCIHYWFDYRSAALTGIFSSILETWPIPQELKIISKKGFLLCALEFKQCFVKNSEKNTQLNYWNQLMNKKNKCLGWHLPSFKRCNKEVALDF